MLRKVTWNAALKCSTGVTSCVHVCFGFMSTFVYQDVQCASQILCVLVRTVYSICLWGLPEWITRQSVLLCCMHYLIRMNFSNNPLLASVDHRGKTKTGPSFITFLLHQYVSFFRFRFRFFIIVYTVKLLF